MEHSMEHMKEHHIKIVEFKKKFFLKSFVISLVFFIFSVLLCLAFYDSFAIMAEKVYKINPQDYGWIFGLLFGLWKIAIIQFTLIPFIALACMQKHLEKCKKSE